jgi:hypothetical protein
MKPAVKAAYRAALDQGRTASTPEAAFAALERAHILGQRDLLAHFQIHMLMLQWARAQRDGREISGQVLRLLAVLPGFVIGWVPVGNPGGSNISALTPVPLSPDIKALLGEVRIGRDIAVRAAIASAIAVGWLLMR